MSRSGNSEAQNATDLMSQFDRVFSALINLKEPKKVDTTHFFNELGRFINEFYFFSQQNFNPKDNTLSDIEFTSNYRNVLEKLIFDRRFMAFIVFFESFKVRDRDYGIFCNFFHERLPQHYNALLNHFLVDATRRTYDLLFGDCFDENTLFSHGLTRHINRELLNEARDHFKLIKKILNLISQILKNRKINSELSQESKDQIVADIIVHDEITQHPDLQRVIDTNFMRMIYGLIADFELLEDTFTKFFFHITQNDQNIDLAVSRTIYELSPVIADPNQMTIAVYDHYFNHLLMGVIELNYHDLQIYFHRLMDTLNDFISLPESEHKNISCLQLYQLWIFFRILGSNPLNMNAEKNEIAGQLAEFFYQYYQLRQSGQLNPDAFKRALSERVILLAPSPRSRENLSISNPLAILQRWISYDQNKKESEENRVLSEHNKQQRIQNKKQLTKQVLKYLGWGALFLAGITLFGLVSAFTLGAGHLGWIIPALFWGLGSACASSGLVGFVSTTPKVSTIFTKLESKLIQIFSRPKNQNRTRVTEPAILTQQQNRLFLSESIGEIQHQAQAPHTDAPDVDPLAQSGIPATVQTQAAHTNTSDVARLAQSGNTGVAQAHDPRNILDLAPKAVLNHESKQVHQKKKKKLTRAQRDENRKIWINRSDLSGSIFVSIRNIHSSGDETEEAVSPICK